jgi:dolichyl-phosphate-mannose--protein O-mannosyl transferase
MGDRDMIYDYNNPLNWFMVGIAISFFLIVSIICYFLHRRQKKELEEFPEFNLVDKTLLFIQDFFYLIIAVPLLIFHIHEDVIPILKGLCQRFKK